MAKAKSKRSFEEQMAELEAIIAELEAGENDLDQALQRYADGVKLVKACREQLTAAEQVLTKTQAAALAASAGEDTDGNLG